MAYINPLSDSELETAYQTNEAFDMLASRQKKYDSVVFAWEEAKEGWQHCGYNFVPRRDEQEAMNTTFTSLCAAELSLKQLLEA